MVIVNTGSAYIDIDGYAGIISYAELLNLQGTPAKAASIAPLNESITKTVRIWPTNYENQYVGSKEDKFVIIDVSGVEYLERDPVVDLDKVVEVIDHHPGYEEYWAKKLGSKAQIEPIGAACTLVYERWVESGYLNKMSQTTARLLICGILDNTLNLGAIITHERDRVAYRELSKIANLPDDWPEQYFGECQEAIEADIKKSIKNDHKADYQYKGLAGPVGVGQLAVWDAKSLIKNHLDKMTANMNQLNSRWFMNLISIKEKKNYIVTHDEQVQDWLSEITGAKFLENIAVTERMWLRKEITKADLENNS
jgi:inorganic pyrophosphatase/exopolyphosphatase